MGLALGPTISKFVQLISNQISIIIYKPISSMLDAIAHNHLITYMT